MHLISLSQNASHFTISECKLAISPFTEEPLSNYFFHINFELLKVKPIFYKPKIQVSAVFTFKISSNNFFLLVDVVHISIKKF